MRSVTKLARLLAFSIGPIIVVAASTACSTGSGASPSVYTNEAFGWFVTLPNGWKVVHPVADPDTPSRDVVPALENGTLIAWGPATIFDGMTVTSLDQLGHVPAGGATIGVTPSSYDGFLAPNGDDGGYPPPAAVPSADAGVPPNISFKADGVRYDLLPTFGAGVSDQVRQEAAEIVGSFTVPPAPQPPPAEGTAVVRFEDRPSIAAWRLGPVERFPAGSVVRVEVERTPGVEQPRSLFIVTPERQADGVDRWMTTHTSGQRCEDLRWTGTVFHCGSDSWRMDGTPTKGTPTRLSRSLVIETYEGQLLVALDSYL